ncbi:O-antigen ligase family protein [Aeromicrobium flavum]|uniref:O-antigen ligase family protein n=1 Tax=Aeromicrobium flavum TaxID=416568 RepID=UPI0011BE87D2|nr:O-antigen ligase family protein [Aeromicrobium flavum]
MAASVVVFMPGGFDRFVWPKLAFAALAVGVGMWAPGSGRLPRTIWIPVAAALAAIVVSAAASAAPLSSLLGRWPRYEGLPVLLLYVGSAVLGAHLLGTGDRGRAEFFRRALVVAAALMAVVAWAEIAGFAPLGRGDVERSGGLLGNATDQAVVALMIAAVLVVPALARETWALVGIVCAGSVVAVSGSRAVLLATVVVVAVHVLARRDRSALVLLPATAVVGLTAVCVPVVRNRLLDAATFDVRRVLWADSIDLLGHHLLLGVGPSGYVDAIGAHLSDGWLDVASAAGGAPDSPHVWVLQAWNAGGVVGLAAVLVLAVVVLVRGLRRVQQEEQDGFAIGAFAAVLAYGLVLLTHFTIAGTVVLAAFLAGALVAEGGVVPRSTVLASSVLATLFVPWALAASVADVQVQLGVTHAMSGDAVAADREFAAAAGTRGWDSDVAMLAAQSLAGALSSDPEAVDLTIDWADRSLERTPDTYATRLARAVALNASGRQGEALQALDELVADAPAEADPRIQRAIARLSTGDVGGARTDVEQAERIDRDHPAIAPIKRVLASQ